MFCDKGGGELIMADDFFKEETTESTESTEEKIKIGEREFTQEELDKRIGLSDIAMEAEEKYNRPISKFWPEYTKANQELERVKAENEELKKTALPKEEVKLTDQEEIAKQAKDELNKLGYIPAEEVEQRARKIASEVVSGYKLLDRVDNLIENRVKEGYPSTTREELLGYMQENGLQSEEMAYKLKYEKEIDAIKEKKIASIKPSGIMSNSQSTAGAKSPSPVKVTRDNLHEVLDGYLGGNQ